jgi:hypothetical protein
MKKSVVAVSAALALVSVEPLGAEGGDVVVGSRIRFRAPEVARGRLEGTVVSVDESAFAVRLEGQKDAAMIKRSAVEKLEIRTREGRRLQGALFGFLIGTALGTAIGSSSDDTLCGSGVSDCNLAFGAVLLGAPFAALGALAAGGAHWQPVPAHSVALWVAPRRDRGVEARVSVRF